MIFLRRGPARPIILALLALALAGAGFSLLGRDRRPALPARAAGDRPQLMLLTTLPLIFPEHFSLEGGGSKALDALETRHRVVPIGVADGETLGQGGLLLMAHPLAQPAEALVELDRWVRSGGRVLILADPKLDWPSDRPLGDLLRPPPAFADTGLLRHWGLRLDPPERAGLAKRTLAGQRILTSSPGQIFGRCAIAPDRFVAECRLGRGSATIVADADFLNVDQLDGPTRNNLDALLLQLSRMERDRFGR